MQDRVKIEIRDQIAFVSLNRPEKHNGMDVPMLKAVSTAQNKLRKNKDIRVIILQGEGPSFCSGLDFKAFRSKPNQALLSMIQLLLPWRNIFQKWSMGWRDLPVPVIALMHGNCFGAGIQLGLGADIRIATPNARLSIMEARWGLVPDMGGAALLKELLPIDIVKELTMTGRIIRGTEAKELGLVTHISEDPMEHAMKICAEIIEKSPDSVGASKFLLQKAWRTSDYQSLRAERIYQRKIIGRTNQKILVSNTMKKEAKPFIQRKI